MESKGSGGDPRVLLLGTSRSSSSSTSKIISSKEHQRPFDVQHLRGNYSKAKKKLGWKPKIHFKKLIKIMVEEDISRWERWLKGEQFPWDAATSGEDSQVINKKR